MRTFIAGLLITMSAKLISAPVTHIVTYSTTSNVVCSVGDTLKFYATNAAVQGIQINSITVIAPMFPPASNYVGYYVIIGGESSYTFYNDINIHVDHTGSIVLMEDNTGIFDSSQEATIKVFPNPAAYTVIINSDKEAKIEFSAINGKTMLCDQIHEGANQINISSLSPGTYFLRINHKSTKIIKY